MYEELIKYCLLGIFILVSVSFSITRNTVRDAGHISSALICTALILSGVMVYDMFSKEGGGGCHSSCGEDSCSIEGFDATASPPSIPTPPPPVPTPTTATAATDPPAPPVSTPPTATATTVVNAPPPLPSIITNTTNTPKTYTEDDLDKLLEQRMQERYKGFITKPDYQGENPAYYASKGHMIDSSWDNEYTILNTKYWLPSYKSVPPCIGLDKPCEPCPVMHTTNNLQLSRFDGSRKILPDQKLVTAT